MYKLSIGGVMVWVNYIIGIKEARIDNLIVSYFTRSEMAIRSVGANLDLRTADIIDEGGTGKKEVLFPMLKSESYYTKINAGKEHFYHGVTISKDIKNSFIITNKEKYFKDIYSFLMREFNLPLLKEWIPFLLEKKEILKECECYTIGDTEFLGDILIFRVTGNEKLIEETISNGLKSHEIKICDTKQKKLQFENMDDYFQKYGFSILANLKANLNPLQTDINLIEYLAFFNKRLFPKQANVVNGAIHLLEKNKNYCIVNQGMGSGKVRRCGVIKECA